MKVIVSNTPGTLKLFPGCECPNTLGTMKSDMASDEESEWAMLAGTLKATKVVY
jgi:hypothetical protein